MNEFLSYISWCGRVSGLFMKIFIFFILKNIRIELKFFIFLTLIEYLHKRGSLNKIYILSK